MKSRLTIAADRLNGTGPVTFKGRDWSATVPSQVAQDMRDGAALRRLRERLPARVSIEVVIDVATYGAGVVVRTSGQGYDYVALGPTLASAADDCLEALRYGR